MDRMIKKRIGYGIATLVLLLIEVLIALYVHDDIIRPYGGDILVVIPVYTFIRVFFPDKPVLLPLYVFLFAVLVEFLQYIHIVDILGLSDSIFWSTVIGVGFDWKDIGCYAIGCIVLGIYEWVSRKVTVSEKRSESNDR